MSCSTAEIDLIFSSRIKQKDCELCHAIVLISLLPLLSLLSVEPSLVKIKRPFPSSDSSASLSHCLFLSGYYCSFDRTSDKIRSHSTTFVGFVSIINCLQSKDIFWKNSVFCILQECMAQTVRRCIVRSDVEERVAEERPAWNDKNIPAWPKDISVL